MKAKVEIYYFGCCPYSYFFSYSGGFIDETWTRTGGDFKEELERRGVEVAECNMLENPNLVDKLDLKIDPFNPFSSYARFLIEEEEVTKEEFFRRIRGTKEEASSEDYNQ